MPLDFTAVTGNILLWQIPGWYRLSSRVFHYVEAIDFDKGLDIFIPIHACDAKLGAAIRQCHAVSRRVAKSEFPKRSAADSRKAYKSWEKTAVEKSGRKSFSDFGNEFSAALSLSTDSEFFFSNFKRVSAVDLCQALPHDSGYKEAHLSKGSSDADLGAIARKMLATVID